MICLELKKIKSKVMLNIMFGTILISENITLIKSFEGVFLNMKFLLF